jgi:hypothetical protein
VIGYVLGKVDPEGSKQSSRGGMVDMFSSKREMMMGGHVTSLAILSDYRRLRLASQLMDQLHHQMLLSSVSSVGLHVRVSNKAAAHLYESTMGYHVSKVISKYYQDGEDAYLMKKSLPISKSSTAVHNNNISSNYSRISFRMPNTHQLPRLSMRQIGTDANSSAANANQMLLPRKLVVREEPETFAAAHIQ